MTAVSIEAAAEKKEKTSAEAWETKCRVQIRGACKEQWHNWVNTYRKKGFFRVYPKSETYKLKHTIGARSSHTTQSIRWISGMLPRQVWLRTVLQSVQRGAPAQNESPYQTRNCLSFEEVGAKSCSRGTHAVVNDTIACKGSGYNNVFICSNVLHQFPCAPIQTQQSYWSHNLELDVRLQ